MKNTFFVVDNAWKDFETCFRKLKIERLVMLQFVGIFKLEWVRRRRLNLIMAFGLQEENYVLNQPYV
jgi:hypothetical protein